jgi:hypothetical protein
MPPEKAIKLFANIEMSVEFIRLGQFALVDFV